MSTESPEFDLKPDPRILPMLGEINLPQWRCLAELVDNAVDGFLATIRAGEHLVEPQITVEIPLKDDPAVRISVTDNGPGMSPERLEKAVRAGWSGNNPIDSLGMFGMGFNIATARLGTATTVWTSRLGDTEEHGLRIDFDELRKQGHFRTPRLTRPKIDPETSGTSITIERLKDEQRAWFAKPVNRSRVKKELARAYSSMLRSNGVPMHFKLLYSARKVKAISHCVWDDGRSVETARHGTIGAVQQIDRRLPDRPFCTSCWQWLPSVTPSGPKVCPSPSCSGDTVVQRRRHVHGWIGIQRYLSNTDYGIDFVRNGRKIEIGSRELFTWREPDSETVEPEYPIDDPRSRGRFVGEIHLDHCRVTYMKDRFDRTDPAWDEMVRIVRGEGPLLPQKAASLGFGINQSPLFKLFQAFRRSSPPRARQAGEWSRVLVVKDNDRAVEMAKKFHEGDPKYQTDSKWWALVEEEDNSLLTPKTGTTGPTGGEPPQGGEPSTGLPGFGVSSDDDDEDEKTETAPPVRTPIPSLTREYFVGEGSGLRYDVKAYAAQPGDPDLIGLPWKLTKRPDGDALFLVDQQHDVFGSATMTELDALLCEMAHKAADFFSRTGNTQGQGPSFAEALTELRDRYGGSLKLDLVALANGAEILFRSIARVFAHDIEADDANELFAELPARAREEIHHRMAARTVGNPQQIIADGRFLEFAPSSVIVEFILAHPELFFDGRCWEDSYSDIDYIHAPATAAARQRVLQHFEALLHDASWLSTVDPDDLATVPREQLLRSMLACELLSPTRGDGET